MNSIEQLIQIFSSFPGIGHRQARRFVYYLLFKNNSVTNELIENLKNLKNDVITCADCKKFFERKHKDAKLCSICLDDSRDRATLMIVPRDIDMESLEKNGVFKGVYFILGGTLPILEKEPEKKIRLGDLLDFVEAKSKSNLSEVIIAMNWNPEGENTSDFITKHLELLSQKYKFKVTHLGKGLSMGAELEYTDPDTLKNALKNRN